MGGVFPKVIIRVLISFLTPIHTPCQQYGAMQWWKTMQLHVWLHNILLSPVKIKTTKSIKHSR